ncbi:MAG: hypothetical protein WDO24_16680 [Pseudomonadota bacterium]
MTVWGKLWRKAPIWRTATVGALFFTGLAALFPPPALWSASAANPATPPQSSYHPTTPPVAPPTQPAAITVPIQPPPASPIAAPIQPPPAPPTAGPAATTAAASSTPSLPSSVAQASTGPASTGSSAPAQIAAASGSARPIYGKSYSGTLNFFGIVMPLPVGEWTLIARVPEAQTPATPETEAVALAKTDGDKLIGLIVFRGNLPLNPSTTGFRADVFCDRTDLLYANTAQNENLGPQDCVVVNYGITAAWDAPNTLPVYKTINGELKLKKVAVPRVVVFSYFRLASKRTLLQAWYYFNPEIEGFPPAVAGTEAQVWSKYKLPDEPKRQAYVQRVTDWTERWSKLVHTAAEGKLKEGPLPAPWGNTWP